MHNEAREAERRSLHCSIVIQQPGRDNSDIRPLGHKPEQCLQASTLQQCVGVQDHKVLATCFGQANIVSAPKPQILSGLNQTHIGLQSRPGSCTVPRRIIDHYDLNVQPFNDFGCA
jgi:hypothetical protein